VLRTWARGVAKLIVRPRVILWPGSIPVPGLAGVPVSAVSKRNGGARLYEKYGITGEAVDFAGSADLISDSAASPPQETPLLLE